MDRRSFMRWLGLSVVVVPVALVKQAEEDGRLNFTTRLWGSGDIRLKATEGDIGVAALPPSSRTGGGNDTLSFEEVYR